MRCSRCGGEIHNVPEHLASLAKWLCQQCANTNPRKPGLTAAEDVVARQTSDRKKQKAA